MSQQQGNKTPLSKAYCSASIGDTLAYYSPNQARECLHDSNFDVVMNMLDEKTVSMMLDKYLATSNELKSSMTMASDREFVSSIAKARHFSEDFLLKYAEYLSTSSIMEKHASDILSGAYSRLALLLDAREKDQ